MKLFKKVFPIILSLILVLGCAIGVSYAYTVYKDLPIAIPTHEVTLTSGELTGTTYSVMESWRGATEFIREPEFLTVEERLEAIADEMANNPEGDEPVNISTEANKILTAFPYLDKDSFLIWVTNNPEALVNGADMFLLDEVDYYNTPTGIKTVQGDDVLAIDMFDGIMIVGRDVESNTGTSKVKLAIVNNKNQLDMSLVKNLTYWSLIEEHAEETEAILAINASGYTWNTGGQYAVLYGAVKYHDTLYRKQAQAEDIIGFLKDGTMTIGENINNAYNAFEMNPILMVNGEVVQKFGYLVEDEASDGNDEGDTDTDAEETTKTNDIDRCASTAIAQKEDGTTFLLIASGGLYGSKLGVVTDEIVEIFLDYDAYNAAQLSGGSRAVMYWNGRVVNETVGYDPRGVKIPNTIYVKSAGELEE